MKAWLRVSLYGNVMISIFLAAYFAFIPAGTVLKLANDPKLRSGELPETYFDWHRSLSEDYAPWARERVESGRAVANLYDISGTEWPMFSSVFYLWATENLQQAWEKDTTLAAEMPTQYAREAIEAAVALVADPRQAAWVKQYWGEDYLEWENLFYRMLLISGLTSYQNLLEDSRYEHLLRGQVDTLAAELEASPHGLLDDYPNQCYQPDIVAAIAAIQRADRVLGTNHAAFLQRAVRGFGGDRLDPNVGLPSYRCNADSGQGLGAARGVGNGFMLAWAPELWPETSRGWYSKFEQHYWVESWFLAGLREYPRESGAPEWFFLDVDAGPILAGYGTAASAFGIGAARANGHFEHAYPLSAEAFVAAWPLPNGRLLTPSLLSNLSDAPFTGETALLFSLTRPAVFDGEAAASQLPFIFYFGLGVYLAAGIVLIVRRAQWLARWRKAEEAIHLPAFKIQLAAWSALVLAGVLAWMSGNTLTGAAALMLAQLLPRQHQPPRRPNIPPNYPERSDQFGDDLRVVEQASGDEAREQFSPMRFLGV